MADGGEEKETVTPARNFDMCRAEAHSEAELPSRATPPSLLGMPASSNVLERSPPQAPSRRMSEMATTDQAANDPRDAGTNRPLAMATSHLLAPAAERAAGALPSAYSVFLIRSSATCASLTRASVRECHSSPGGPPGAPLSSPEGMPHCSTADANAIVQLGQLSYDAEPTTTPFFVHVHVAAGQLQSMRYESAPHV